MSTQSRKHNLRDFTKEGHLICYLSGRTSEIFLFCMGPKGKGVFNSGWVNSVSFLVDHA